MKKAFLIVAIIAVSVSSTTFGKSPEAIQAKLIAASVASKPAVAKTAPASAFAILDKQDGNALIGVDGYYSVLWEIYCGAQELTLEKLDRATHDSANEELKVCTKVLNKYDDYSNAVVALASSKFSKQFKTAAAPIGVQFADGANLSKDGIANLNEIIHAETGIANAIESSPSDGVLFLSISKQKTAWVKAMQSLSLEWNNDKRVPGLVGEVPIATAKAPNGAKVYHLQMKNDVVLSIVFVDEVGKTGFGEWAIDTFALAGEFESKRVQLPKLDLKKDLNLKNVEALQFLFTSSANFNFGTEMMLEEARQKAKLTLNEKGLEAVAVTYATARPKGLITSEPEKGEIAFDRPFYAVWSYGGDRNKATFAVRIEDPSQK